MNLPMHFLALTPDQFGASADAWLNVLLKLVGTLGVLAVAVVSTVALIKSKMVETRLVEQDKRMDRQGDKIDNVMLNTPAPSQSPTVIVTPAPIAAPVSTEPAKVEVVNTTDNPVHNEPVSKDK